MDLQDWRLQGQEKYLKGLNLYFRKYKKFSQRWDHDHCEFCNAKFCEISDTDCHTEGYTTENNYYWICNDCFSEFKIYFGWKVSS